TSRSGEYADTEVWDFRHDESGGLSLHPQAEVARGVLADIFRDCAKEQRQPLPSDFTEALRLESQGRGAAARGIRQTESRRYRARYHYATMPPMPYRAPLA